MVARRQPKRSLKKTIRKVIGSLKPGAGPRINPDAIKTGPRRRKPKKILEAEKNLKLLERMKERLKKDPTLLGPKKSKPKPKLRDLLYRPKRDKDGNIIKPKPRDLLYRPKYDSKGNIIKPKAVPMKARKPKKK